MNYRVVLRLLAAIIGILGLGFAGCLAFSLARAGQPGEETATRAFAFSLAIAAVAGGGAWLAGRRGGPKVLRKEAMAVTGLGWIVASVLGALPFWLALPGCSPVDALFESASGFTTTGASVFADVESMPASLLLWRALTQWIGGMGVVLFFVALLGSLGAGGRILFSHESSGALEDLDYARVHQAVRSLFALYVGLSLACLAVYRLCGLGWFDAVAHMFATVSTGGFSTRNAGVGAFDSAAFEWAAVLFMALGGTSFVFLLHGWRTRRFNRRRHSEVTAYGALLAGATVIVAVFLLADAGWTGWHAACRDAAFQVVSIMTTTGFASADYAAWAAAPKLILLLLMIVGGCSSSTAGGVKVTRLVVAAKVCLVAVEQSFRPQVVRPVLFNDRPLGEAETREELVFLALAFFVCLGAIPLTAIFEPTLSLEANLSAVFACLFNIGPGLAELGPTQNFAALHPNTKILLALLMIMGRLEFYAVLALFLPSLWRRYR